VDEHRRHGLGHRGPRIAYTAACRGDNVYGVGKTNIGIRQFPCLDTRSHEGL